MSLIDHLNLPAGFGYLLLVLGLVLTLAPWFHGHDFGVIKIPDFGPPMRRSLMVLGPLALAAAVYLHLPDTVEPMSVASQARDQSQPPRTVGAATPPRGPETVPDDSPRTFAEWQGSGCYYPVVFVEQADGA